MNKGVAVSLFGLVVMGRALFMLTSGVDKYQANWVHMTGMALVIIGFVFANKSDES